MQAIRVTKTGGPEQLELVEIERPAPAPNEVLVRVEAVGVNFIDVYHRTGLYPSTFPYIPGSEGAGVVEELGTGVKTLKRADRVAWARVPAAYAQFAVVPEDSVVNVPPGIDAETAAAAMLQGMTAHYLAITTYPLKPGDTALVHAAAGGVGALLTQVARFRGARVFGTVSTEEKAKISREAGAEEVILYTKQDFQTEVMRLTSGKGVNVVYDSVGRTTFDGSLGSLRNRGMLVMYGQSSGPVPPFDLLRLSRSAAFLTRPSLGHYIATRDELLIRAHAVFTWIREGTLKVRIDRRLPLSEAGTAHQLLETRQTAGKLILVP